ncbi:Co-chaperone Hsc20 [Lenzites betulinus]|nr:Co-chaperone Hsc20 [Lenzites betulinus]
MFRLRALASFNLLRAPLPSLRYSNGRRAYLSRHIPTVARVGSRNKHTDVSKCPKLCPSCSSPLPTALPVCSNCSFIEPIPQSMTYHEMLGTPYEPNPFLVDVLHLKKQFRAVQSVVHPDRWVSKPPDQQAIAAAMSSRINEALHRLTDPLRRAEYILAREGHASEETDSTDDPELLMVVMEAREGLDCAESEEDVAEIRAEADAKTQEVLEEITQLVAAKNWPALRKATVKLRYLRRIELAAAAWPDVTHDE